MSQTTAQRLALLAAAAALTAGLAACNKADDRTAGQKLDDAIERTEQAAQDAKDSAAEAAQEAKEATQEAAADAQAAASEAGASISAAASEAGAAISAAASEVKAEVSAAAERAGDAIGDVAITASVNAGLAKDEELSALSINVDTKDGHVTLNGTAPNAAAKERATSIAREVEGVKSVDNQLTEGS